MKGLFLIPPRPPPLAHLGKRKALGNLGAQLPTPLFLTTEAMLHLGGLFWSLCSHSPSSRAHTPHCQFKLPPPRCYLIWGVRDQRREG